MKIIHLSGVPKTVTHNTLRQKIIDVGDVKTGLQTVNYVEMKPKDEFEPHSHPDCEEYFFAIDGEAQVVINGKSFDFKKGDFLVAEKGEMHSFVNNSEDSFVYLAIRALLNE